MLNKLDNLESMKTIDKSNMSEFIKELPDQIVAGLKIVGDKILLEKYQKLKNAVLVGMGGSASAGDLLLSQPTKNFEKPITLLRDSTVPGWVDKKTLAVLISHSGQTKETLSAFKQSASLEAEIIVVAERGALEKFGAMENAFVYDYNTKATPRASLGFQLGILVGLFNQLDFFQK